MFGPLAGLAGAKGRLENASGRAHVRAHTPCSSTKERKNCINWLLLKIFLIQKSLLMGITSMYSFFMDLGNFHKGCPIFGQVGMSRNIGHST